MDNHQIELVQTSFARLIDNIDTVAEAFYQQLFELDPSLRALFKTDMQTQGRKLMQTLLTLVNALNNPDQVIALGERVSKSHLNYGVKEEHYATVGQALLLTIKRSLGEACTHDVEAAWLAVYAAIVAIVKKAAYPSTLPA
jgi:hemoglobin-like flavoprotein